MKDELDRIRSVLLHQTILFASTLFLHPCPCYTINSIRWHKALSNSRLTTVQHSTAQSQPVTPVTSILILPDSRSTEIITAPSLQPALADAFDEAPSSLLRLIYCLPFNIFLTYISSSNSFSRCVTNNIDIVHLLLRYTNITLWSCHRPSRHDAR
jgi:hypothetical protein